MERKYGLLRKNETKLEYGVRITTCVLVCIFVFIALLGNLLAKHTTGVNFTISVFVTALIMYFIAAFAEKTADAYRTWLVFIFIAAFASRLIMISAWPIEPTSDFESAYKAALALADAEPSEIGAFMKDNFEYYYSSWSVHMPFILLQQAIIKVFGPGYYPIQVFFALFSSLSCVVASAIAKVLYGRRAGVITGITMAFLPPVIMYSPILSNQHIATFFFLLAIYILIERPLKHRLVSVAISSVCIVISHLVRPEMTVFIVVTICYFVYKYILGVKNKRKLKTLRKKFIGYCVMTLGIFVTLVFMTGLLINEAGYVKKNITSGNYKYKIAVGLNAESQGRWNEADSQFVDDEAALDGLIKERTQNKLDIAVLAAKKIMHQYGTYNYDWCIQGKTGDFVKKWYESITNGAMLVILFLSLFKGIMSIYNKSRRELLLLMAMFGYFLIYTVLEVQNRYNYFMIPLFVILASGALVHIYGCVQIYIENFKNKKEKCLK